MVPPKVVMILLMFVLEAVVVKLIEFILLQLVIINNFALMPAKLPVYVLVTTNGNCKDNDVIGAGIYIVLLYPNFLADHNND